MKKIYLNLLELYFKYVLYVGNYVLYVIMCCVLNSTGYMDIYVCLGNDACLIFETWKCLIFGLLADGMSTGVVQS